METLVVVAEQRRRYCGRVKSFSPQRLASSSSRNFRDVYCRTFLSGAGIPSIPLKCHSTPLTGHVSYSSSPSPSSSSSSTSSMKTPSPSFKSNAFNRNPLTKGARSSPVPITGNNFKNSKHFRGFSSNPRSFSFSERWAGPTYSNSPPPSSVPIPKFSLPPMTSMSVELPVSELSVKVQPSAKSAPASPTSGPSRSAGGVFDSVDFATKTLRRILNLEDADD